MSRPGRFVVTLPLAGRVHVDASPHGVLTWTILGVDGKMVKIEVNNRGVVTEIDTRRDVDHVYNFGDTTVRLAVNSITRRRVGVVAIAPRRFPISWDRP